MKQIGRLAMRHEGDFWNAYYAMPGTMKDAIFLGSVAMRFVQDPLRKAMFMGLMQDAVGDLLREQAIEGVWPGPQPAPESERSGHS